MPAFECPTCRKVFTVERREDAPLRPFCSERCKMIDLGRWLDGTYAIPDAGKEDASEKPAPITSHDELRSNSGENS